ncbi:MAG: diacylglycerol kinase family protein [Gemmatimonadota bacterium]
MRSYFVIFNGTAGRGRAARSQTKVEQAFQAAGVECELVATDGRGHAEELAYAAVRDGWPAVVAVGGDGIVHEVANGLMRGVSGADAPTVPLGIIAVGSGNDFVKMLGTPVHQPEAAVRRIVAADPRGIDIGRVTAHDSGGGPEGVWYFTNGVGVGFDAQVAAHARRVQHLRGAAIYGWAIVKTLKELRSPSIQIIVDGREVAHERLLLTTVSNGPCHGGSFWLCPGASLDDGMLDVLTAKARSLPAVLNLLPRVVFGKHLGQWGVQLHRGAKVVVRSDARLPIHADGEIVAEWVRELEIEVLPGRLTVLA